MSYLVTPLSETYLVVSIPLLLSFDVVEMQCAYACIFRASVALPHRSWPVHPILVATTAPSSRQQN